MAYTEADLVAVRSAMLRGERRVQYADRMVEYRSIDELKQVEQSIILDLNASSSATPRSKQTLGVSSKGF